MAKMGRPYKDEAPRDVMIRIRVTSEFKNKIDNYCLENNDTMTNVFEQGAEIYMRENKKE